MAGGQEPGPYVNAEDVSFFLGAAALALPPHELPRALARHHPQLASHSRGPKTRREESDGMGVVLPSH